MKIIFIVILKKLLITIAYEHINFIFATYEKLSMYKINKNICIFLIIRMTIYLQLLCDANSMLENFGSINIDDVSVGLCTTI